MRTKKSKPRALRNEAGAIRFCAICGKQYATGAIASLTWQERCCSPECLRLKRGKSWRLFLRTASPEQIEAEKARKRAHYYANREKYKKMMGEYQKKNRQWLKKRRLEREKRRLEEKRAARQLSSIRGRLYDSHQHVSDKQAYLKALEKLGGDYLKLSIEYQRFQADQSRDEPQE